MKRPAADRRKFSRKLIASSVALAFGASAAHGDPVLPSGGVVTAGSASIIQTNPASTLIVQQGAKAIINWQDFSVAAGTSVTFQQPNSAAITLNRVIGPGASVIDGSILANGQVWLLNRGGILIGQGSHIDVGGILATTSDINDADFLSGHYAFGTPSGNPAAAVVNRGSIKAATGGSAVLSGSRVSNEGVIEARLGQVVLGGANTFSVTFDGDRLLQYAVGAPNANSSPAEVSNSGTIAAQGGRVLMTARAARSVVDNVINVTGIVEAKAVSVQNGEVVLDAGEGGTVNVTGPGALDVSGKGSGESGGTITVLGKNIGITDGGSLNASGEIGGGTVQVGGTAGQPSANVVNVDKAAIRVDAIGQGRGGTIAIVSTDKTRVNGYLSAKGVAAGGVVETSGEDLKIVENVRVDTSATAGATGLWLLNPSDIDAVFAGNIVRNIAATDVIVRSSHGITVNAPVLYDSANSLSFQAGQNLTLNASVQNGGTGAILAVAGWDGVTAASAIPATPSSYGNNGGNVLIGGANAAGGVALGSRFGAATIAANDLTVAAQNDYAQLGYHAAPGTAIPADGDVSVLLKGSLALTGGSSGDGFFAQIGHGGLLTTADQLGDIHISAAGPVTLAGGSAAQSYALIGNGSATGNANQGGRVLVASASDITLGMGSMVRADGAGDALVLASGGNFTNLAGAGVLDVTGGGRWLVFLNNPANNTPGGLSGTTFYNRAFDFVTDSYAAVTGAGDRFAYALAPVLTVTANSQTKTYGTANPVLTASITGALPGDAPAGVFSGAPTLATAATASSGAGNYAIVASPGTLFSDFNYGFRFVDGALHIDPVILTASLTGTARKVYDGTRTANLDASNYSLSGVIAGDSVSLTSANALYSDKNVGTAKTVSASGLSLLGAAGGNYILASSTISGAIGVIDAAALTASLTGTARKAYDGTTTANLNASNYSLAGLIAGDSVSLSAPASSVYGDKNVGTAKTVNVSGLALVGADRGNYVLTSSTASGAIGVIDPAVLTGSLTGTARKTYDGTTTASLNASNTALSGVIAGDSVSLNASSNGVYSDKNVGTAKTVSAGGLTLSGADRGNYILASSTISGAIGMIDAAALTASLTGTTRKTYDGTTAAILSPSNYALSGVVAGDSVVLNAPANGVYSDRNAGTAKVVSVGGLALLGADRNNYTLVSTTISGAIGVIDAAAVSAVVLTASLTGTTRKVYDGTTAAILSPSNYALSGVIAGDSVALNAPANGVYNDKNVGTAKIVSVGGLALLGVDKDNYTLLSSTISGAIGVIDPAIATALLTGVVTKVYDGNAQATLDASNYALSGVIGNENVLLNNPVAGLYDNQTNGSGKTVSVEGLALSGPDAGNYVLASSRASAAIGVITVPLLGGLLGTSFNRANFASGAQAPAAGAAQPASDATSATGAGDDSTAFQMGQSLSAGSAQSSTSLIDGLLRQFAPPPGSAMPHGIPPYGQVYSSWGNEAFWQ